MGDVDPFRIAPLGDDVTVARDDAARGSAILDRPDDRAERFLPKAVEKEQVHIVRARRVRRNRRLHGFVDQRGVHRDFVRPLVLPVEPLGEVRRARRCGRARRGGRRTLSDDGDRHERKHDADTGNSTLHGKLLDGQAV